MKKVTRYKVLQRLTLGFTTARDQYDLIIKPGAVLEGDGDTIWLIKNKRRLESITIGYAIKIWLKEGIIEEIKQPK